MFCPKCGVESPDDSQFCRKCGKLMSVSTSVVAVSAPPKRNVALWILVPLLALVVVWVAVRLVAHQTFGPTLGPSTLSPQARLYTETFNKPITIRAVSFYYVTFTLPPGSSNVKLQGHFAATGGSGNDVEVFLLNEDAFTNWKNGHQTNAIYNSGKVTQDSPNVNLPTDAGTYYLVFNNRFSLVTPKAVEANLTFTYSHL
jgi:hypothetical protein